MSANATEKVGDRVSDQQLVERAMAGQREAYAELIRRHHSHTRGLCLSILSNGSDADDAVQEIFVKAYSGLSAFQGRSAFSTWLYRTAVNHCLNLQLKRGRQKAESLEALSKEDAQRLQRSIGVHDIPQDSSCEDSDLVLRALSLLRSDYRTILTLREMEGLEYKELMEVLDCSLDSVKARLRRAREAFRGLVKAILAAGSDDTGAEQWTTKR